MGQKRRIVYNKKKGKQKMGTELIRPMAEEWERASYAYSDIEDNSFRWKKLTDLALKDVEPEIFALYPEELQFFVLGHCLYYGRRMPEIIDFVKRVKPEVGQGLVNFLIEANKSGHLRVQMRTLFALQGLKQEEQLVAHDFLPDNLREIWGRYVMALRVEVFLERLSEADDKEIADKATKVRREIKGESKKELPVI